jgi:osmotically-inducible protein OsmY
MKLDSRNLSSVVTTALLAFALSGCGQEPPPKQAVKAVPVPVPAAQDAAKAEPAKPSPEAVRAAADKELAGRVKAALGAERSLNAHGIDVVASNGAVTLFGTAETRTKREIAGKVAAGVEGVKSVENKLAIVAGS